MNMLQPAFRLLFQGCHGGGACGIIVSWSGLYRRRWAQRQCTHPINSWSGLDSVDNAGLGLDGGTCTFIGRTSTVLRSTADTANDDWFSRRLLQFVDPTSPRQTSRPRVHPPHRHMLHVSLVLLQEPRA